MQIAIKTIPHTKQRYDTCGDWQFHKDRLTITVSETGNGHYNFLVALHELIEAYLCKARGISQKDVDNFDMSYEGNLEPGDRLDAPYHLEHAFATYVEWLVAEELDINWKTYDNIISKL